MSAGTRPRLANSRVASSRSGIDAAAAGTIPAACVDAPQLDQESRFACLVERAGAGDHPLIYELLRTVFHGPTESEFHAQLDHPRYRPPQRLLVRRNHRPAAHARVCPREVKFGALRLPAVWLADLATLPEFRGQGYATSLLGAAEQEAERLSAELLMLRTSAVDFYRRRGWVVCGRHSYSTAPPRSILALVNSLAPRRRLPSIVPGLEHDREPLRVRLWRHVELDKLTRLYDEATSPAFGPLVRSEAYWRWLLSRRGYDRIYVAVEDAAVANGASPPERVVGYSVMLRGRVVELVAEQDRADVRRALLVQACGDAIERNDHEVRYDGPPGDPMHGFLAEAGGAHCRREADAGHVFMARVPSPPRLLRCIAPIVYERARLAGLPRPLELGLLVDGQRWSLLLNRRSARLILARAGRSYLTCSAAVLTQLLLGHLDVRAAISERQIAASTRAAADVAAALFPQLPFWHPPLDDLPA